MEKKYYLIVGIVAIIVIVGTILLSRNIQQVNPEAITAPQDIGKIEATVLSLTQLDLCPVQTEEECPVYTNPRDSATIIVDSILDYQRDSRAEYLPLSEGMQFDNAYFDYSSRPAKVKHIRIQPAEPGPEPPPSTGPVLPPSVETPLVMGEEQRELIPRENGLYVYTIYSAKFAEEYETVLSGVSEGDKIRVEIVYSDRGISLGEYEVIS